MSNVLSRQITLEGQRNVVVKWTGVLDSSDIVEAPALRISEMLSNDTVAGPLLGFRVDIVEWSISAGMEVTLEWDATEPQQIFPLAGRGRINGWNYGGYLPDMSRTGYTGDLNLRTAGYTGGTVGNFTVAVELIKLYRPSYNGNVFGA